MDQGYSNSRRVVAVAIAFTVFLVVLFSVTYEVIEINHDCSEQGIRLIESEV